MVNPAEIRLGVAVRVGPRAQFVGDDAVRAAAILHHHLLAPGFGQPGPDDARLDVAGTAWCKWHDQPDRLRRIGLS